jgi:hypothetical protein
MKIPHFQKHKLKGQIWWLRKHNSAEYISVIGKLKGHTISFEMGINLAMCSIMAEVTPLFLRQLVPKKWVTIFHRSVCSPKHCGHKTVKFSRILNSIENTVSKNIIQFWGSQVETYVDLTWNNPLLLQTITEKQPVWILSRKIMRGSIVESALAAKYIVHVWWNSTCCDKRVASSVLSDAS